MDWVDDFSNWLKENPIDYSECDNYMKWGGSLPGDKSPRWGMKNSQHWHDVISEKFSGEGNPFYGKKHTEETSKKMKEAAKKRHLTSFKEKQRISQCKGRTWGFLTPEGKCVIIEGSLNKFCGENNLNTGAMCQVHKGNLPHHKGWRRG